MHGCIEIPAVKSTRAIRNFYCAIFTKKDADKTKKKEARPEIWLPGALPFSAGILQIL